MRGGMTNFVFTWHSRQSGWYFALCRSETSFRSIWVLRLLIFQVDDCEGKGRLDLAVVWTPWRARIHHFPRGSANSERCAENHDLHWHVRSCGSRKRRRKGPGPWSKWHTFPLLSQFYRNRTELGRKINCKSHRRKNKHESLNVPWWKSWFQPQLESGSESLCTRRSSCLLSPVSCRAPAISVLFMKWLLQMRGLETLGRRCFSEFVFSFNFFIAVMPQLLVIYTQFSHFLGILQSSGQLSSDVGLVWFLFCTTNVCLHSFNMCSFRHLR